MLPEVIQSPGQVSTFSSILTSSCGLGVMVAIRILRCYALETPGLTPSTWFFLVTFDLGRSTSGASL